MPNTIINIAIHHSGSIGADPYSSSAHLSFQDIENAHKARFNMLSSLGRWAGYNVIYDPKSRQFWQSRALGEETAAQKGFNFDTFSLCIIGNYNKKPDGSSVDPLTQETKDNVINYLIRLCRGEYDGIGVKTYAGATVTLSPSRIWPHRHFGQTQCYGSSIPDDFFRNEVQTRFSPTVSSLSMQLNFLRDWLLSLKAQYRLGRAKGGELGCEGFIKQ